MKPNGAMKMIAAAIRSELFATATRKRWRRTAAGGLRRTSAAATGTLAEVISARRPGVVDPAAGVDEDQRDDDEGDAEQDHRKRRRVAHVEVHEAVLVEQHRVEE